MKRGSGNWRAESKLAIICERGAAERHEGKRRKHGKRKTDACRSTRCTGRCTFARLLWGPVHCIKIAVFFQRKALENKAFSRVFACNNRLFTPNFTPDNFRCPTFAMQLYSSLKRLKKPHFPSGRAGGFSYADIAQEYRSLLRRCKGDVKPHNFALSPLRLSRNKRRQTAEDCPLTPGACAARSGNAAGRTPS